MDKLTYLAELAEGLARWVPERERQDILRYYAEYFEEAGPGREAEVVQELGDPWALSCRLAVEGGYVTTEQAASWTPRKKKKWPWVLACLVAVAALAGIRIAASAASFGMNIAQRVTSSLFGGSDTSTGVVDAVEENTVMWEFDTPADDQSAYIFSPGTGKSGFWSTEDGILEPFTSIDADISLGNITVTGGPDYTLYIDQDGLGGGYEVSWEIKNGKLKLRDGSAMEQVEVNSWKDLKNIFGASAVNVCITVPEWAELETVKLKTNLGDIYLADLEVSAKAEAETSMGNVECYEVRTANKLDLESSMGNVSLGLDVLYGGMEVELETSMGNVDAQINCTKDECDYEAKTSMGNVTVNGADRGTKAEHKGGDYKLEAKSDMGNVDLYFSDDRW